MKRLLLLISTLALFTVQGQETKPKQKILIGYNFSPDYSFRTLKNNDGGSSGELVIKNRNDIELAKLGYTTGISICMNVSQLVGFETGIQFSNKGYKVKSQDLIYFPPNPGLPTKAKISYAHQYIGIPLKAKFTVGKRKTRLLSSIGFMANFLLNVKQTSNYEYADGKTEEKTQSSTSGFKKVDISPMVSVGLDHKINYRIHITAEPTFRYGLIKTTDSPVTENLWSAGLNIGLYYGL